MDKNIFYNLIECGVRAPSGDNLQPWKIQIQDDSIKLSVKESKLFFEPSNMGAYISSGAFLENISYISADSGLEAELELYEDTSVDIAEIRLSFKNFKNLDCSSSRNYRTIFKRATLRTPYKNEKISPEFYDTFHRKNEERPHILIFSGKKREILEDAIYSGELVRLGVIEAHYDLASNLKITNKEISEREGLDYRTLGIPLMPRFTSYLLKSWRFMNLCDKFGANKLIAYISTKRLLKTSEGLGVLTTDSYSKKDLVNAGRVFERFWLSLTYYGGYIQPFASFPFFLRKMELDKNAFSERHAKILSEAEEIMYNEVLDLKNPVLFFRFGIADSPRVTTLRKEVKSFLD